VNEPAHVHPPLPFLSGDLLSHRHVLVFSIALQRRPYKSDFIPSPLDCSDSSVMLRVGNENFFAFLRFFFSLSSPWAPPSQEQSVIVVFFLL